MNPRALDTVHDWPEAASLLVYGGSFDPPHLAHVHLPEAVRVATGADHVLYVPAACSPHKVAKTQTPAVDRVAMLRIALREAPQSLIWLDEIERAGDGQPSYTIETLRRLRERIPSHVRLHLLIGADQVVVFDRWCEAQAIAHLAPPLVMLRPPTTPQSLLAQLDNDAQRQQWARRIVKVPTMTESSTAIRAALSRGNSSVAGLDPQVLAYIRSHGLYGNATQEPYA